MKTIKTENMTGSSGRKIPNQFILTGNDFIAFQSYDSTIAVKKNGKIYLDAYYWDYSRTTGKYRNQFLNLDIKETRQKIKNGEILLENLNES